MARPSYPSDEIEKLLVRFPPGMRDDIRAAAGNSGRSMNAEIVQRLKWTFENEEEEYRLKLVLSDAAMNALSIDSAVHGVTDEERAVQVLEGNYDPSAQYTASLLKVDELAREGAELSELVNHLKEKQDVDFLLYYSKAVQLDQLIKAIQAQSDVVASRALELATDLEHLNSTEIETLRKRHEEVMFFQNMQEKVARRERELDQEISESGSAEDMDAPVHLGNQLKDPNS